MEKLIYFLVFCQAFGATVGAFSAVWSELAYLRAARDGKIDVAEERHLHIIARGLRFGMTLLLLSSLGLVIVAYIAHSAPQPALTPTYWTSVILALFIIGITWTLSTRRSSFELGSAALFAGWWFLAYLTLGQVPTVSFGSSLAVFVVATGVFYGILQYIRLLTLRKS